MKTSVVIAILFVVGMASMATAAGGPVQIQANAGPVAASGQLEKCMDKCGKDPANKTMSDVRACVGRCMAELPD